MTSRGRLYTTAVERPDWVQLFDPFAPIFEPQHNVPYALAGHTLDLLQLSGEALCSALRSSVAQRRRAMLVAVKERE